MQKVEPQHGKTQQHQPAAKQGGGLAVESPQGEHIAQLEAMMDSSPQSQKLGGLAAMMNNSPAMAAQRKLADMMHNSPRQAAQRKLFDSIHNSPHQVAQKKKFDSLFGAAQRVEDEEPLQGKFEAVQRVAEEEPLQHKLAPDSPAQLAPAENKPNNTGLPDNLKSGIENLSGMSMDSVKVHYNSSQPAQLNALAYAQGTDIHVAPGQEQHLPHEAWHVVQQAQGRVQPTMQMKEGIPVNDDKGLEHEADVMGGRAVQLKADSSFAPKMASGKPHTIQRYLIVGSNDFTRWYREMCATHTGLDKEAKIKSDLDGLISQIAGRMISELNASDQHEKKVIDDIKTDADGKLRKQITKWIEHKVGDTTVSNRPDFGRKNQTRAYENFKDCALALHGWVKAKPGRKEEKAKATEIQSNDVIDYHLNSILRKIKLWIDGNTKKLTILADLDAPASVNSHDWNIYQKYFNTAGLSSDTKLPAKYTDVLNKPEDFNVREKTGILHDMMHYFMEKTKVDSDVNLLANEPSMKATVHNSLTGGVKRENYTRPENTQIRDDQKDGGGLVKPENMPGGSGGSIKVSKEERDDTYKLARSKDLPMYGRHSFSAMRMMHMVKQSGGTPEEISAMAWSIMAYWRLNYDHRNIPYHTLHEIMDFTPEFGVAYDVDSRYKGLDLFTKDGLILSLQKNILANPNKRDIDKLITTDTAKNNATWFLAKPILWANIDVMNFLSTTVLPYSDFIALPKSQLQAFFSYNLTTKHLLTLIPKERRDFVTG